MGLTDDRDRAMVTVRVAVPVDALAAYDSVDDYVQSAVDADDHMSNSEEFKAELGLIDSEGEDAD